MGTWFSRGFKSYGPEMILDVLEERIVLDASVAPTVDNHAAGADATASGTDVHAVANGTGSDGTTASTAPTDTSHDVPTQVSPQKLNVVLVSNEVSAVEVASTKIADGATVIVYDAQKDNLSTITGMLDTVVKATGQKIGGLAIVDHGSDGVIKIGSDLIGSANAFKFAAGFDALGKDLAPDAQIELFGCSIAHGAEGQALINQVASYAHSVVFASTDPTGGTAGDWTLEYSSSPGTAIVPLIIAGAGSSSGTELIFSGWSPLDDLSNPNCHQYFSALDSSDMNAVFSGTNLTSQYAELWTFHLDFATNVLIGMQTTHPNLTHGNATFIDCWLDLFSGTTPTSAGRMDNFLYDATNHYTGFNDDWVGPGTNQVPDWSGNDSLLTQPAGVLLPAGDYVIQATSWNNGSYNYMNGGYYLLSNVPLFHQAYNPPGPGHYVDPPGAQTIPNQYKPENFGTFNYDVHSYFTDPNGATLQYELVPTPPGPTYLNGLTLNGLTINAATGVITFTSSAGSDGSVAVQVRAHNGELYTHYETFLLTVSAYDLPTADPQSVTLAYVPLGQATTAITVYGHDPDGDGSGGAFAVLAGYGPIHGTLGAFSAVTADGGGTYHATVTYTSSSNYWGPDGFLFTFSVKGGAWKNLSTNGVVIGTATDIANTYDLAVADLNQDGHPDLVAAKPYVAAAGTTPMKDSMFYVNDGHGSLQDGVNLQYPSVTSAGDGVGIVTGDLNGDGFPDVVVRNGVYGGTSSQPDNVFLWDDATHTFILSQQLSKSAAQSTGGIALGDFNGDGRLDIVRVYGSTGEVFLNLGDGIFPTTPSFNLPALTGAYQGTGTFTCVATGDFNNDGSTDIFVGKGGGTGANYNHVIFYNDRNTSPNLSYGNFTQAHEQMLSNATAGGATDVAVGDVDHDGNLDIVIARGTNGNYFYKNNSPSPSGGMATWAAERAMTGGTDDTRGITLADVNGDGYLEALAANYGQTVRIYQYNGTNRFNTGTDVSGGALNAYSIAAADVDGDGTTDIIVGVNGAQPQIFYNRGFGAGNTWLHGDPGKVTIDVAVERAATSILSFEDHPGNVWYSGWALSETPANNIAEFATFGILPDPNALLSQSLSPWNPSTGGTPPTLHDWLAGSSGNNDQQQYSLQLLDPTVFPFSPGITLAGNATDHVAVLMSGGLRDDKLVLTTAVSVPADAQLAYLGLEWDMAYWNSDVFRASGHKFDGPQFVKVTLYDFDLPNDLAKQVTWTTTNANSPATGVVPEMEHFSLVAAASTTNGLVQKIQSTGANVGVKIEVSGMEWYFDVALDHFRLMPYKNGGFGALDQGAPDLSLTAAPMTMAAVSTSTSTTTLAADTGTTSLETLSLASTSTTTSSLSTLQSVSTSLTSSSATSTDLLLSTSSSTTSLSSLLDGIATTSVSVDPSTTATTASTLSTDATTSATTLAPGPDLVIPTDVVLAGLTDHGLQDTFPVDGGFHAAAYDPAPAVTSVATPDLLAPDFDPRLALVFDPSETSALHILEAYSMGLGFQQPMDIRGLDARLLAGESLVFDMDAMRLTEI